MVSGLSVETDFIQSKCAIWQLRGAEGDRLTERSEGRKLPELQPRCPRHFGVIEDLSQGVLRGGCKGGREGGVAP